MNNSRQAIILCGYGYGDECKGSMTDYLARVHKAHTVVRYNGASQAAHNVVLSDGRHHTFAQFGSATFIPAVRTHLSRHMLVNPIGMLIEADKLESVGIYDACDRATVDGRALLITPFHMAANRLRELARGDSRHGSCGKGVGETARDSRDPGFPSIRIAELHDLTALEKKLKALQRIKQEQISKIVHLIPDSKYARREMARLSSAIVVAGYLKWYESFAERVTISSGDHIRHILGRSGTVIFEGSQGALLDEVHGFHPYVTWTDTTMANAEKLIEEAGGYGGKILRYGLMRAYSTRHGPGPFVTEDAVLGESLRDAHNGMGEWQRGFRVGWFDLVAARYAISFCGKPDGLVISCVDRLQSVSSWKVCVGYDHPKYGRMDKIESGDVAHQERLGRILGECRPVYRLFKRDDIEEYLAYIEGELGVPIVITSHGPTEKDKRRFSSK